jgi:hypothetical protein
MTESFYRRWIFANSWSEGVGLSATLLLGLLATPSLEAHPNPLTSLLREVLAVIKAVFRNQIPFFSIEYYY